MDSPKTTTSTTTITPATATSASTSTAAASVTALSDSPPVQESPFSNYVSNLSPIKPVKHSHVGQGILGLNSPPLVFTSPRTISDRQTNFLRFQCSQTSGVEVSKNSDGSQKSTVGLDDLVNSDACFSGRLTADAQKSTYVKNSPQDQPGSSSGCVDEYLSDPVEADCADSVSLVNPNVKPSGCEVQLSESGLTNLTKDALKLDDRNHKSTQANGSQEMSEKAGADPQEQSMFETKTTKVEEEQTSSEPFNERPNFEPDLHMDDASRKQCDILGPEALPLSVNCGEDVRAVLHGPVQNITHHGSEANQLQRGLSRRCLQFEEAQQKTALDGPHSSNATCSISPASPIEVEILDASHAGLTISSSKKLSMTTNNSGKSPLSVSKPSGIGLHLNSIVNALPMDSAVARIKLDSIMSRQFLENKTSCSKRSNLVGKVSSTSEDRVLEPRASLATSSATSESYHTMESLNMLQPLEHQVTPHNKRMFISEHADDFEEFNQSSPKKKRKKLSSSDGDGCKRCNCKKTKCLKLYCDCFAAGIYCAETCACQGCFNRPEYEDTVLETRQQIESRNPLAFAPKIVQHATEFPPINREDGGMFTPSSGRHKRGCNCKRSLCLKKYCECYQANVGCSAACRCEGCKNIYGKKGEYSMTEEIVRNKCIEERSEMVDDKLEMGANNTFLRADLYDLHNLTPPTPSYEKSSHGKGAPKSRLLPGRYVISSESDFSRLPSYAKFKRSPSNPHSNASLPERSKETLDIVSFGQGIDYNLTEMMGQFSPQFNEIPDVSDLTPLPNSSSMTMASSASSKTQDNANVSRLQLYPGSGCLSSSGSLHWLSSPITPMTQLGETKNQAQDSDCGLYEILEDDTPEILKESPAPVASVKVSSPNKKRVSPPHGHIQEFGSNSSGGLKSGRKFILKAVPSFPPLTPCVDSKDRTHQKC